MPILLFQAGPVTLPCLPFSVWFCRPYRRQKSVIPVHYFLWMAEVGCAKVASANVETVFSGAGRLSMKSHCLGPQLLSDYAYLHYNYKYD